MQRRGGTLDEAGAMFERAVAAYPEFAEARIGLARVLVAQGHPDRALPHLQKAVALDPDNDVACTSFRSPTGSSARPASSARRWRSSSASGNASGSARR